MGDGKVIPPTHSVIHRDIVMVCLSPNSDQSKVVGAWTMEDESDL